MSVELEIFGLRIKSTWLTPSSRSYRPPSWPPPRTWVVSEDRHGDILSLYGDSVWDISPWAGRSMILDFGDDGISRKAAALDRENADLLRLATTWRIWGIRSLSTSNSIKSTFLIYRRVIAWCSENKIAASDLMRFPRVFDELLARIPPSEYSGTILELHRLWDARDYLGFIIVDEEGLKRLAAGRPDHEHEQTAYIPPRIWTYQVRRLKECLDDYLAHKTAVEECFNYCIDAYAHNFGSLEAAMMKWSRHRLPFSIPARKGSGSQSGVVYHGTFGFTAERFGIAELMGRWITIPSAGLDLKSFSGYLSLVQHAGLAYIANFTLQRVNEAASLRADCLTWERDEKLGQIPIIAGETTKTDPDNDARWPTSPSVKSAVEAMTSIARLRIQCAAADPKVMPTPADIANPYLLGGSFEPWTGNSSKSYSIQLHVNGYRALCRRFTRLFDEEELRITEEDLKTARMVTPNLSEESGFAVGQIWPLAWHQLRRTGAVNMFASGILSDSSLQFQMKHASRVMPLYYARGYAKLQLNEEVESLVVEAMYEAMAHKLLTAMGDRFVSPLGKERKDSILVNLIDEQNVKKLASAARRGSVRFREMRLGACTHRGTCSYGGVESISRCAGGDGAGPCADALYDRTKAPQAEMDLRQIGLDIALVPASSPRHKALLEERTGLEQFLDVVRRK